MCAAAGARRARHPASEAVSIALVRSLRRPQQVARLRIGRRIEPLERMRIVATPGGKLQCERGQVRLENLRRRVRRERVVDGFAPEPIAHTRRGAARAAAPLIRRRARDAHGVEPIHAGVRIKTRTALVSAVDDDAHALIVGSSPRCSSRRSPCGAPAPPRAAPGPARPGRALRTAARRRRCGARRAAFAPSRGGSRARPAGTRARRRRAHRARAAPSSTRGARDRRSRSAAPPALARSASRLHARGVWRTPSSPVRAAARGVVRRALRTLRARASSRAGAPARRDTRPARGRPADCAREIRRRLRTRSFQGRVVLEPARQDAFGDDSSRVCGADVPVESCPETDRCPSGSPSSAAIQPRRHSAATRRGSSISKRSASRPVGVQRRDRRERVPCRRRAAPRITRRSLDIASSRPAACS